MLPKYLKDAYSTTKKMQLLSQIIYSCKTLYMFRSFRPLSGAQICVHSNGICKTAAATCCYREWDGIPSHPRLQQLFDIYRCCIRSFELL